MKVVILAGGKGTRLAEKTKLVPKPMVKIGNKPIIWHIIQNFRFFGFKDFIIATGYKSKVIENFFKKEKSFKNLNILIKNTGLNSMTGFRVKKLEKYLKSSFILTYGDGLSNIDYNKLIKFHTNTKSIVTLTTVNPPPRWGYLMLNKKNKIISFKEKVSTKKNLINAGFMVVEKEIFKYLKYNNTEVLESDCFLRLVKKRKISAYYHNDFWQCMDTLRENLFLNKLWKNGVAPWRNW